jgi:L-gulonolactone oxidase
MQPKALFQYCIIRVFFFILYYLHVYTFKKFFFFFFFFFLQIRLDKLYTSLKKNKLALAVLPNTDKLQLGGIIANSSHGTNLHQGTICSLVNEVELLVSDGTLLRLRRNAPEGSEELERFEAAIASVGHVGIVYSVTLQCVPEYNVIVQEQTLKYKDAIGNIESLLSRHGSLSLFLSPPQQLCFSKLQAPVAAEISHAMSRDVVVDYLTECWLYSHKPGPKKWHKYAIGALINWLSINMPWLHGFISGSVKILTWDDGEIMVKSFKDRAFLNCEYSLPLHNIDSACYAIADLFEKYKSKGYYRKAGWLMRPTAGDSRGFLSPTRGNSPRVYIDIPYQQMDELEFAFFRELEADLVKLDGRVSWARRYNLPSKEATKNYGEYLTRFSAVVRQLDPTGMFSSPMRRDMLGF